MSGGHVRRQMTNEFLEQRIPIGVPGFGFGDTLIKFVVGDF
jgi:hypothetical protein